MLNGKTLILVIVLLGVAKDSNAQTFDEWFKQRKTQIKYLLKQIAALEVYTGSLKKGYTIVHTGLDAINEIKHGDFHVHSGYFSSLQAVNPKIGSYSRVASIITIQVRIMAQYKKVLNLVMDKNKFDSGESAYLKKVLSGVLAVCNTNIDELVSLTTANHLELKDDERLKRIDELYVDMQDQYTFIKSMGNEVQLHGLHRCNESKDVKASKILQGLSAK